MSPEDKIYKVLDKIERERRINQEPNFIKFKFNSVVDTGIVSGKDERKILLKLEQEGAFEIIFTEIKSEIARIKETNINNRLWVSIGIESQFEEVYKKYKKYSDKKKEYWNFINPFWLFWRLILILVSVFKKYKISSLIALVAMILTLLAHDYAFISKNFKSIIDALLSIVSE